RRTRNWLMPIFLGLILVATAAAQNLASLNGQVTDELGGVIVGASVTLIDSTGRTETAQTDETGTFHFKRFSAGRYTLRVVQTGFATYMNKDLDLKSGQNTRDVKLGVTIETQRVTVDEASTPSDDPNGNKSAQRIAGKGLNALSDDPDELAAQLNALAGPAA